MKKANGLASPSVLPPVWNNHQAFWLHLVSDFEILIVWDQIYFESLPKIFYWSFWTSKYLFSIGKVRQLQNFNITVRCFNLTYFYEYISSLGMDLACLVCLESWGERLDIKRSSFFCNQVFFLDVEGSQLSTLGACWEKISFSFSNDFLKFVAYFVSSFSLSKLSTLGACLESFSS